MDNKAIAGLLYETADLLEIDNQDPFRIRSYRRAAEAVESLDQQVSQLITEPKKLLEVPGIGKGMLANLQDLLQQGQIGIHTELIQKYRPSMLELLKIQGLGPKTIALIWSAYQVADLEGVEKLARRKNPNPSAYGREARAEVAEGDRGLSSDCRTISTGHR